MENKEFPQFPPDPAGQPAAPELSVGAHFGGDHESELAPPPRATGGEPFYSNPNTYYASDSDDANQHAPVEPYYATPGGSDSLREPTPGPVGDLSDAYHGPFDYLVNNDDTLPPVSGPPLVAPARPRPAASLPAPRAGRPTPPPRPPRTPGGAGAPAQPLPPNAPGGNAPERGSWRTGRVARAAAYAGGIVGAGLVYHFGRNSLPAAHEQVEAIFSTRETLVAALGVLGVGLAVRSVYHGRRARRLERQANEPSGEIPNTAAASVNFAQERQLQRHANRVSGPTTLVGGYRPPANHPSGQIEYEHSNRFVGYRPSPTANTPIPRDNRTFWQHHVLLREHPALQHADERTWFDRVVRRRRPQA